MRNHKNFSSKPTDSRAKVRLHDWLSFDLERDVALKRVHSGGCDEEEGASVGVVKKRPGPLAEPIRRTASTPANNGGGGPKHSPPFKKSTFSGKAVIDLVIQ